MSRRSSPTGKQDENDELFDDFVEVPHPKPMSRSPLVPEYRSLRRIPDEIRLLSIFPASGHELEPISCSMIHASFRSVPDYEALSYTWGKKAEEDPVIIVDAKRVTVRENLWQALKALQLPYHKRKIWVDSICINQNDVHERNHQVRMMSFIYERARNVMIWLGSDHDEGLGDGNEENGAVLSKLSRLYITKKLKNDWSAREQLNLLCNNKYWKRLWIIQEIQKARAITVFCGTNWTTWSLFIQAVESCVALEHTIPLRLDRHRKDPENEVHRLSDLLEYYQYAMCEDPRDKVFGLTGLATDIDDQEIVDYSKSVEDVWKKVVVFENESRIHLQYGVVHTSRSRFPLSDCLYFSGFLQNLLRLRCPRPEVPPSLDFGSQSELSSLTGPCDIFRFEGVIIGTVQCVGPTYGNVLGSYIYKKKWESMLLGLVVPGDAEMCALVRKGKNEKFMQQLLDIQDVDFTRLEPLLTGISWKVDENYPSVISEEGVQTRTMPDDQNKIKKYNSLPELLDIHNVDFTRLEPLVTGISRKVDGKSPTMISEGGVQAMPILDDQKKNKKYDSMPEVSSFEARRVELSQPGDDTQLPQEPRLISMGDSGYGLAPQNTDIGDLVFVFDEHPTTIVLRKSHNRLHIVGRALVQGISLDEAGNINSRKFLHEIFQPLDTARRISVLMDAETLGFLTRL